MGDCGCRERARKLLASPRLPSLAEQIIWAQSAGREGKSLQDDEIGISNIPVIIPRAHLAVAGVGILRYSGRCVLFWAASLLLLRRAILAQRADLLPVDEE